VRKIFLLLFLIYYSVPACFAQQTAEVRTVNVNAESVKELKLDSSLEILEGKFSFDQVSSGKYDGAFLANKLNVSDLRAYKNYWARIKICTHDAQASSWILKSHNQYDNVNCYIVYSDSETTFQKSGWSIPPDNRSIQDPDVVFNLILGGKKQNAMVYLFIQTDPKWFAMNDIRLAVMTRQNWEEQKIFKYALLYLYCGICLLAFFYWFISYIYSGRINYLYLIAATVSILFATLDAFNISIFFGHSSHFLYLLSQHGSYLFWIPTAVFINFTLTDRLNHFKDFLPRYFRFCLWGVFVVTGILFLINWFGKWIPYNQGSAYYLTNGVMWVYFTMLYVWLGKRHSPTKFALIAYLPSLIGWIIYSMASLGFLPEPYKLLAPISSIITVILLFYGMVIYVIALRQKRENEMHEKQELVLEQNIILENKVEERTHELEERNYELRIEKKKTDELLKKSDELLLNILPVEVAEELKEKGSAEARLIDEVTVLFTDFKGFTSISEKLSPKTLVAEINDCFSAFDNIMDKYGVEKIKTIGDSYMAAGGLPTPNKTHPDDVVKAALEIQQFMQDRNQIKEAAGEYFFEIRIGVHTGPVVAGIVGIKKFQYDIWGDTVNTASRMESSGEAGKVNISGTTYELIKGKFSCEYRGEIDAKGKGMMKMYFVE